MAEKLNHANLFNTEFDFGGGTTVIANPPEEGTQTLVRIKIDDVVYNIEGGVIPSEITEFISKIVVTGFVISSSDWVLESPATYSDYPYRADITIVGATSQCSPDVRFDVTEDFDKLAPMANADTDKVMIYASELPSGNVSIPVIILDNPTLTTGESGFDVQEGCIFMNSTVLTTDWVNEAAGGATPTYDDFPYRADIIDPSNEITSDYTADVRFDLADVTSLSSIISSTTRCDTGKIMIYASELPNSNISIPAIICIKTV